jgi:DNA-binding transcriptional ArsR family regulator
MVVRTISDAEVDRLFRALADATRRDILRRSIDGEVSVSTLASYYDMSFAAVQKHVAVLQAAGLVSKLARGRERLVQAEPEPLALARALLTQLEGLWRERGRQLDDLFAAEASENAAVSPTGTAAASTNPPVTKE